MALDLLPSGDPIRHRVVSLVMGASLRCIGPVLNHDLGLDQTVKSRHHHEANIVNLLRGTTYDSCALIFSTIEKKTMIF